MDAPRVVSKNLLYSGLERGGDVVFSSVSATRLRVSECLFAAALLLDAGWRFLHWREALTDWGFHPSPVEMWQWGFMRTIPLPPVWAIPLIGLAVLASVIGVWLNFWRRLALVGCLVAAIWVYGVDPFTTQALNRILIGVFLVLATGPGLLKNAESEWIISVAPIRILQATLVIIYFAAGYTKATQGAWLESSQVLWNIVQGYHRTDFAAFLLRNLPVWSWSVMQWTTLIFELGAPLWFALRWTRLPAVIFGISLHIMIMLLMHRLYFFGLTMLAFYPLFLPDSLWSRIKEWWAWWNGTRSVSKPAVL